MKKFRFPLARVEHYGNLQLELAEEKLQELLHEEAETRRRIDDVAEDARQAREEVRQRAAETPVAGTDLGALGCFLDYSQRQKEKLDRELLQLGGKIQEQRLRVLAAERNVEMLGRARKRRFQRWTAGLEKEVEIMASENYLARWNRQGAGQGPRELREDSR